MRAFLHWFFIGDNPVRLFGFFPAMVWLVPLVLMVMIYFPFFETAGGEGWYGCVQLSPVLRCIPPVYWVAFFGWFIPHILKHRPH
jgi:hypothetical protein